MDKSMTEEKKTDNREAGEVMLEGIIVMVVTMITLVFILGIGFIYYQRYVVTAITNDAAVKIADTYDNPSSDLVIGYVEPADFVNRDLYRWKVSDELQELNQSKAQKYIEYYLKKTNFNGVIGDVDVEVKFVSDSALRKHVEVESVCEFNTPFGFALEFLGMDRTFTYQASARADCTDKIDYISETDFQYRVMSANDFNGSSVLKVLKSGIKLAKKLIDKYNHEYD